MAFFLFIYFLSKNQNKTHVYNKKKMAQHKKKKTSVATFFFYGCIKTDIRKQTNKDKRIR